MAEFGHGVQIVKVMEALNHSYELDENALEQILMKEEIKDLPVVVISVAGAYRGGKSFLLNFFIRYLMAREAEREDGSWLGEESKPLGGFKWRNGIERTTMGVLMWSEPFINTLPSGEKVAVILIDTQGTFDSTSTVRDCSIIFALSTLLSSVQIYNLSQDIQEDDLQHLQLFTKYGSLVKDQGPKAFQVLQFLVRDWQFAWEYSYGFAGGNKILMEEKLKITPDQSKAMQDLRRQIISSYEKIKCFLMPHPGFKVLAPNFNGNIADISTDFKTHLKDLVKSLFLSENLVPKTINGQQVKAQELVQYFKTYMGLFNSGKIPNPTSILKATIEAGLRSTAREASDIYEKGMNFECGPDLPSVPALDLKELHEKYLNAAQLFFKTKKKMGSDEECDKYYQILTQELKDRLPLFVQSNLAKIQTAINNAKETYDATIQDISKGHPLCVHPLDLRRVHEAGRDAAIKTFDAARKRITSKEDEERTRFIQDFEKQYDLLRLSNEKNNQMLVSTLRMEYWQYMLTKTALDPPLSDSDYKQEHNAALDKANVNFDSKRNIPNQYTEDVYKYNLEKVINDGFVTLKAMNKSKNKVVMQAAVEAYNHHMKVVWDTNSQCLHPEELKHEHQNSMCRALVEFRPRKVCSEGFDSNDEDEVILVEILMQRYKEFQNLNDSANKTAVQTAFNLYVTTMENLCRPTLWWLLIYPLVTNVTSRSKYHEDAKTKAIEVFYRSRSGYNRSSDAYKDNLEKMMDSYFGRHYSMNAFLNIDKAISFIKH